MELNVYVVDFNLFFIYNIFKIFVFQNKKIVCYFFLYFFKFYFFIRYMEEKLIYFFMFLGVGLDKKNF